MRLLFESTAHMPGAGRRANPDKWTYKQVAALFGVSKTTAHNVIAGYRYTEIQ